jgi:hypothetical protein
MLASSRSRAIQNAFAGLSPVLVGSGVPAPVFGICSVGLGVTVCSLVGPPILDVVWVAVGCGDGVLVPVGVAEGVGVQVPVVVASAVVVAA